MRPDGADRVRVGVGLDWQRTHDSNTEIMTVLWLVGWFMIYHCRGRSRSRAWDTSLHARLGIEL